MSFCTWFSELFWGKPEPVTPAAPEEKPKETFCRSNRYQDWLKAMGRDIENTKADLIEIKCYGSDVKYRGTINGHIELERNMYLYNCDTLEQVTLSAIYDLGIESGAYYSTQPIEWGDRFSDLSREKKDEQDPAAFEIIPRFLNKCNYIKRRSVYEHHFQHLYRDVHSKKTGWTFAHLEKIGRAHV